ncbi:hypothetical protein FHX34_10451 [Actinoplanes teichomyceticus]|uniref:Uncharacterized protein n=1 Tax=Actinoplanes teichomyceticus TaxID=1867 RepID=A0A561VQ72_ACTTI|nr:hypothetical protein FHX34_10451 [Actinoplanes teichomyceticus]GIF12412.1 hypothetical protein Ate01nite_24440 [Actinoplanes teichomyceticus]
MPSPALLSVWSSTLHDGADRMSDMLSDKAHAAGLSPGRTKLFAHPRPPWATGVVRRACWGSSPCNSPV